MNSTLKFRKARTRTLIQLGGLIEKSGILENFGLSLGDDLQNDFETKEPVEALYGALLELKNMSPEFNRSLLQAKGAEALAKRNSSFAKTRSR